MKKKKEDLPDFLKNKALEKLPLKYRFVKSRGKIIKRYTKLKKFSSYYNDDIMPEGHYKPISKFINYNGD